MRIAVDAMGGDHAPREIVRGAAQGLRYLADEDQLVLYGVQETIEAELRELSISDARISIVHCPSVIGMEDSPVEALKAKRDSSIVRMASAAGKDELDGLISAGNTGAFVAACQLRIKPLEGVSRPGIAVLLPTFHGPVVLCDAGANVAPKPHHIYDYARMCSEYARVMLKVADPKLGIVSIGEEEAKGNTLVKEARALIKADKSLRFVGNVEGRDIFRGEANVVVCDGFVGNVILKLTEGLAEGLFETIFREIETERPELMEQFQPIVDKIWKRHDFAEYGGAPLLGTNSTAIICHGRSDARAIANAIRAARNTIELRLNEHLASKLAEARPSDSAIAATKESA